MFNFEKKDYRNYQVKKVLPIHLLLFLYQHFYCAQEY